MNCQFFIINLLFFYLIFTLNSHDSFMLIKFQYQQIKNKNIYIYI